MVGGAVPRNFIPSVEKGVRAGYPVVDLRVTLTDGKAHPVDSSDMAFQMAGSLALREAATSTTVTLLEPYDAVTVVVPDDLVSSVMSDLSTRRRRLLRTDKVGDRTVVREPGPESPLSVYPARRGGQRLRGGSSAPGAPDPPRTSRAHTIRSPAKVRGATHPGRQGSRRPRHPSNTSSRAILPAVEHGRS